MSQPSTALRPRAGAVAEVIAISVAWPSALALCGAGLVTQSTQLALEGVILFFATYFYTLIRLYQLGSSDTGDEASYPVRSTLPAN